MIVGAGDEGGGGDGVIVDADENAVGAGGVVGEGRVGGVTGEELESCGLFLVDELLLPAHYVNKQNKSSEVKWSG